MANTTAYRGLAHRRHRPLLSQIFGWFELHRQRTQLSDLDAHLRRDLGLSTEDVSREAARPFWDVPQHWRF